MFSVRFRRRVRRHNDFCLSCQNRLSYILDIWDKGYIGLAKCTGWPFHDLDPRSGLWHWLAKICYFGHISGMVGPIDVKRKGSAPVWYWVWNVTLNFDLTHDLDLGCIKVKSQNSCISGIVGVIDVIWKGSELIGYWANCMTLPLTTLMTLTLEFQGQSLKSPYLRNRIADWHGTKRMWVIHSWPWYWLVWPWCGGRMYRIVTGVTSNVDISSSLSNKLTAGFFLELPLYCINLLAPRRCGSIFEV